MKSPLPFRLAAALLLPLSLGAGAENVVLPESGFLVIDTNYYVFDLPQASDGSKVPAELQPLGSKGFFLAAESVLGDCPEDTGNSGEDDAAGDSPGAGLGLGIAADAPQRRFGLRKKETEPATITLATCDGAVVIFASTEGSASSCSAAIRFPFRRGKCPAVDGADPGNVFFSAFDSE